ncbi:hypothetical protein XENTR_v10009978 [Xenopus tropicalis]|nr:hypothetical protein XENTR_v10009978 [Xenopus tropicalis]
MPNVRVFSPFKEEAVLNNCIGWIATLKLLSIPVTYTLPRTRGCGYIWSASTLSVTPDPAGMLLPNSKVLSCRKGGFRFSSKACRVPPMDLHPCLLLVGAYNTGCVIWRGEAGASHGAQFGQNLLLVCTDRP